MRVCDGNIGDMRGNMDGVALPKSAARVGSGPCGGLACSSSARRDLSERTIAPMTNRSAICSTQVCYGWCKANAAILRSVLRFLAGWPRRGSDIVSRRVNCIVGGRADAREAIREY